VFGRNRVYSVQEGLSMENRLRVLLVDDEESFAKIVALGLPDDYDFDVVVAESGQEAIERMSASKVGFDVVVPDYRMPGMSGLDVLRRMNVNKIETPSFMLTAAGSELVVVEAMKLGAYDYCRKEDTSLVHLTHLIRATHERHRFRESKALEEERGVRSSSIGKRPIRRRRRSTLVHPRSLRRSRTYQPISRLEKMIFTRGFRMR
jgi:DNA-binding NtrC family response regulator